MGRMTSRIRTKLYLIEDDKTVQDFVRTTLQRRSDIELVGVSSTFEHAYNHAANAQADMYLVDLGLPDGRGEEMLEELSYQLLQPELLVFTVFGDELRLMSAIKSGATGYVIKGSSPEELLQAIDSILAGSAPMTPMLAKRLLDVAEAPAYISASSSTQISADQLALLKQISLGYTLEEYCERTGKASEHARALLQTVYRSFTAMARERGRLGAY